MLNRRFHDSTRGRIVARLRNGQATVEELATALSLTDNAIRQHLATLERDNLVKQAGNRRGPGAGKPALVYELNPEAEPMLSSAYAPVLAALVHTLAESLPAMQVRKLLRDTGRRLAAALGGRASGDLKARARVAADALTNLGGAVSLETQRGTITLRGTACPLASAVSRNPQVCRAVESLVGEITGGEVTETCDRTGRPRCCFVIEPAA